MSNPSTHPSPAPALAPDDARSLLDQAIAARANAYAPYSRFPVGAALLTEDGRVFTGTNVENVSFGLTNCAERVAVQYAVAQGFTAFRAIAVVGPLNDAPCTPCGACRQVLYEFAPNMPIIMPGDGPGGVQVVTMRDMLPGGFDRDRLAAGQGAA